MPGGSGHEPAHVGYVGQGMLDAAVCGAVFASPNVKQIISGLRHVSSPQGTLVIVKNYTGDKLNFGLASEQYRAITGNQVEMVMVGDDVSVTRSRGRKVGRRGLAGTIFVHKIAGATAAEGTSLEDVRAIAQHVADNIGTIGVSLDYCTVPGQQKSTSFSATEIELGMGIHNEPGAKRLSPQPSIESLVDMMLKSLVDQDDPERGFLRFSGPLKDARVALLVNNFGGLSVLEIQAISQICLKRLKETYEIWPLRLYVGTFLSSLDGPGFSVSLLNLESNHGSLSYKNLLHLLDAPTEAIGWSSSLISADESLPEIESSIVSEEAEVIHPKIIEIPCEFIKHLYVGVLTGLIGNDRFLRKVFETIHQSILAAEPEITRFDTLMGDGDCGITLSSGSTAVMEFCKTDDLNNLSHAMVKTCQAVSDAMGGTSGALYGLFFSAFATEIQEYYKAGDILSVRLFAKSVQQAVATLARFTTARVGSRTLMDALIPFSEELTANQDLGAVEALQKAHVATVAGAHETKNMGSLFGRSTYVGAGTDTTDSVLNSQDSTKGIPDPGACGIVAIVGAILVAFESEQSK